MSTLYSKIQESFCHKLLTVEVSDVSKAYNNVFFKSSLQIYNVLFYVISDIYVYNNLLLLSA